MKKEINVALKSMAIKCRVANKLRVDTYKKRLEDISEKEKIELFNVWFKEIRDAHIELNNYKSKRKEKKRIQELRNNRGLSIHPTL